MSDSRSRYARRYEGRRALFAAVFFLCCALAAFISALSVHSSSMPGVMAIATAGVFFGGAALAPLACLAICGALALAGVPLPSAIGAGIGIAIVALSAGLVLRALQLDPLFRRRLDVLVMFAAAIIAAIAFVLVSDAMAALRAAPIASPASFGIWAVGAFAAQMIGTAFLLRWMAKPFFGRTLRESVETFAAFGLLLGVASLAFVARIPDLFAIPSTYFVLVPLAWIALSLRPRFVTLALVVLASLAMFGQQLAGSPQIPFPTLLWLSVVAFGFLLLAAQEEERRVYKNRSETQVAALENAVARTEAESKAKSDFIAVLSHELRNPLAALVSSIELMQIEEERPEEDLAMIAQMSEHAGTVRELLDDLLDVSRIAEGKIAIEHAECDLHEAVSRAIRATEHYRIELHQSLEYARPKRPMRVRGDMLRLEQIFSNLLANASKYSDPGDSIRIRMQQDAAWVTVRISDEGVGIAPEMLEIIFQPFRQIEQGKRTGKGLGIGLWLVRQLVELHGGTVSALSAGHGSGSEFVVRLPSAAQPV